MFYNYLRHRGGARRHDMPLLWGWRCDSAGGLPDGGADALNEGERVELFGNVFFWTGKHLSPAALEPLRARGDPLADSALPAAMEEWRGRRSGRRGQGQEAGTAAAASVEVCWAIFVPFGGEVLGV